LAQNLLTKPAMKKFTKILLYCFAFTTTLSKAQQIIIPLNQDPAYTDTLYFTSPLGNLAGSGSHVSTYAAGSVFYNHTEARTYVNQVFATTPVEKLMKAQAFQPLNFSIKVHTKAPTSFENVYVNSSNGGLGREGSSIMFDNFFPFGSSGPNPLPNGMEVFTIFPTASPLAKFNAGSTKSWLVFQIEITRDNWFTHEIKRTNYTIAIPYVVEGVVNPNVPMALNASGQPRVITQPSLPVSILHAPPGDQSYSRMETNKTTCQSVENSITTDLAQTGFGSLKLGYAGSVGFVVQIEIEAYVEFSASGTEGNTNVKISNTETCVSTTTGFGTSPGAGEDLFICEGLDYNYGIYEQVVINPNYTFSIKKGLAMVPLSSSKRLNLLTKSNIEDQIITLAADTLNMAIPLKDRIQFKNQLNVWKQIIAINDANIANASVANPAFPALIDIADGAIFDNTTSISTSQTQTLIVDNYVEAEVGIQGVVNIGGSGFSAGYNMRTSKSYGQTKSSTSSDTQTMTMYINDDDTDGPGDLLKINIYRDPMFGTPLFKLQNGSRTSCPYEGGIQRDQPVLQHALAPVDTLVVPNATLNTTVSFPLRICNNSAEVRDYKLRLNNNNGALVNVEEGLLFNMFSAIPAKVGGVMGCRTLNYPVTVSQPALNSPIVSFANLQFDLMDACESGVLSSVWATVNFGDQVKSAVNGPWADPNTWDALRVPQPTDNVTINSLHQIQGSGLTELKCKSLTIKAGGNLSLPTNLKLTVLGN
jgi:hypothetical protein